MKYVYTEKELNKEIPDNVGVRTLIGAVFGIVSMIMLICAFASDSLLGAVLLLFFHVAVGGIGALFIYFARRTARAIVRATTRTPEDVLTSDPKHPFYSSQCLNCSVMIDYQSADLAFRPWFIKGYVECPCCGKPIRHNKKKNVFVPHRYPKEQ